MHTKDRLAEALRNAGLTTMAEKAATGYYDDFLSDLEMPELQLLHDLKAFATAPSWPRREQAVELLARALEGEFDASNEESADWLASADGQDTMKRLGFPR